MATTSTVGISFGADALAPIPRTRRQKAEEMTRLEEQRLAALDVKVQGWSDRLDLADLEAMDQIVRAYRGEGYTPVRVSTPELARKLKIDAADAEARVERLVRAGALERIRRIQNVPVFRPNTRSAVAEKADPLADLHNSVKDTVARIKGEAVPQRAAKRESSFPAGSILRGLQGRA